MRGETIALEMQVTQRRVENSVKDSRKVINKFPTVLQSRAQFSRVNSFHVSHDALAQHHGRRIPSYARKRFTGKTVLIERYRVYCRDIRRRASQHRAFPESQQLVATRDVNNAMEIVNF